MIRSMSARMGALVTANFVAALGVSGLTFVGFWAGAIFSPGDGGVFSAIGWGFLFGLIAAIYSFAISFPFFLGGLIMAGIPTWWILHRAGVRRRGPFIVIAALESIIGGALVFRLLAPGSEAIALLLAIPGGLAGWAICKYGYVSLTPPPVRLS